MNLVLLKACLNIQNIDRHINNKGKIIIIMNMNP